MPQQSFFKGYKPLEADVQKQIMQFLAYRGIFAWRNNTGSTKSMDGKRWLSFGKKGSADILSIWPGSETVERGVLWSLEAKRPGGKLTDEQLDWLIDVRKYGGVASVVETIEDVMKVLENPLYLPERYQKAVDSYIKVRTI